MSDVSLRVQLSSWDEQQRSWSVDVVPAVGMRVTALLDGDRVVSGDDWEPRDLRSSLELGFKGSGPPP
jgi:hypothetical protein